MEATRSAATFMDECVAVAEAVAEAVTEAVAEADQSIHDPSIYRETGLKRRNMKNRFFKKSSRKHVYTNILATFDNNLMWRGSV